MASTTPVTSADAVVTTGAKSTVDFTSAKGRVSAIVSLSGTVSGGSVGIEASHDGAIWVKLASFVLIEPRTWSWDLRSGAYRYFRANILGAIKGGGTVTVTFMEAG